jgi:hypothetical protein
MLAYNQKLRCSLYFARQERNCCKSQYLYFLDNGNKTSGFINPLGEIIVLIITNYTKAPFISFHFEELESY